MSESMKKIRRRDCVKLTNRIIERCRLPVPRVTHVDGIRAGLFTSLLRALCHKLPEGIIEYPSSADEEAATVQCLVDHLALDLIHADLSHISGADVVRGDPRAIYNLLEIFCGLHKYLSSTSIAEWNLQESLTETNSELSSKSSSEDTATGGGREQQEGTSDETGAAMHQAQEYGSRHSPPISRPSSSATRAISVGSIGATRAASAGRVGPSASGSPGAVPSAASRVGRSGSAAAGAGSVAKVASAGSAGRVASAGSAAGKASAARLPSSGSVPRVPSGGAAGGVPSTSSAARLPSGSGSAVRVRSSGSRPAGSAIGGGGEAESPLLPDSEPVRPVVRHSVSTGGGSGGAGAVGSSGAGAEPPAPGGARGKETGSRPELTAAESETSEDDASPLRAPSVGAGAEFAGLGRPSASRPSLGGLPGAAGGSSGELQLTGSIDHHHYHHYEGESAESSQLTGPTADSEGPSGTEREADTPGDTTGDGPEQTREESDSQPQWETSEDRSPEDYPEDSREDYTEETPETYPEDYPEHSQEDYQRDYGEASREDYADEDGLDASLEDDLTAVSSEEEAGAGGDVSRQISEELQRLGAEQPEPAPRGPDTQQKRSAGAFRRTSRDTDSRAGMAERDGRGRRGERPPDPRPSRRRADRSSTSEPTVARGNGPAARPPARHVQTIAEIHESGPERSITETSREREGPQRPVRETVRREVRRKVSSAPPPAQTEYRKAATRRAVRSDGVDEWLESQAEDTYLRVDGREADVFEYLRREFPYVHVSAETKRRMLGMYGRQMKYAMSLAEPVESRKIKIRRQDVLKRQSLMTDIMRQQKAHDDRFREVADRRRREARIRNLPRDSRISCLRAQRYVSSFQQQFQSRSALTKSREELLLRAVFEEMLEIQRGRLRAVRRLEKQAIDEFYDANGYTADLNRVHQYYEANFRQLAELLARERADLMTSQRQQRRLGDRIRREFRDYMEADVRSLNDKIVNSWQPQFRELDADRVRSDLYEANWKFCVQ